MSPLSRLRLWVFENRFHKRVAALQHEQVLEQHQIVGEIRQGRRAILHQTADIILRLEAVSDALEESLGEGNG